MKCSLDVMKCSAEILFHCPHLLNQGLLSLSADRPGGQEKFQAEQHQEKQAHFQYRKLIGHDLTGKGSSADLPAHHHRNRKSDQQNSQGGKGRIAEPFANVHPAQLLSGQADGAQDAVLPLPRRPTKADR